VLDDSTREQMALFRYGLIADLAHRQEDEKGLYRLLQEKADKEYVIPNSRRTRVAAETIRDWLKAFRRGGFAALRPQPRRDQGRTRAIPQQVADWLCQIKEEAPALSVTAVIAEACAKGIDEEITLAPATVHRLLARHGLMDKSPKEPTSKDRRRFAFDKAGELWMSDVMHGPAVTTDGGRKRKTYLVGLLDEVDHDAAAVDFRERRVCPQGKQLVAECPLVWKRVPLLGPGVLAQVFGRELAERARHVPVRQELHQPARHPHPHRSGRAFDASQLRARVPTCGDGAERRLGAPTRLSEPDPGWPPVAAELQAAELPLAGGDAWVWRSVHQEEALLPCLAPDPNAEARKPSPAIKHVLPLLLSAQASPCLPCASLFSKSERLQASTSRPTTCDGPARLTLAGSGSVTSCRRC